MKRLLDASGGVIRTYHDEAGDKPFVRVRGDAEPIIEENKRLQNEDTGWTKDRSMKRVASIPAVVYQNWQEEARQQGIMPYMRKEWSAFYRKKLADPDNKFFLCAPTKTRFRSGYGG